MRTISNSRINLLRHPFSRSQLLFPRVLSSANLRLRYLRGIIWTDHWQISCRNDIESLRTLQLLQPPCFILRWFGVLIYSQLSNHLFSPTSIVFFTSFACFLLSGPGPLEWKSKISTNNTTYCDSVRYTGDVILILMPKVEIEGPIAI